MLVMTALRTILRWF